MLRLRLKSVETHPEQGRYYYIGQEVSLQNYDRTSFDVTDIRAIDRTVYVYVWHNGQETLYDRFSMDHVAYLEGVTLADDEAIEAMDAENAEVVLETAVCVAV
ncbi:hypothetical protein D3C76_878230 [compost metagenome]